jgi:hypothetical protein
VLMSGTRVKGEVGGTQCGSGRRQQCRGGGATRAMGTIGVGWVRTEDRGKKCNV